MFDLIKQLAWGAAWEFGLRLPRPGTLRLRRPLGARRGAASCPVCPFF